MIRQIILRLFESYFRHRWLYLLPIGLMTVLAGVFYFTLKPTYIARGVIYVQSDSFLSSLTQLSQTNASFWVSPSQLATNEINELLQTSAFIRAIIQKTDLEPKMNEGTEVFLTMVEETRNDLWISSLGTNQILSNAAHEDPIIAYQLVSALMDTFINWQINTQQTDTEVAQAFFIDLVQKYEQDLTNARNILKTYLQDHPEPIRGERPGEERLEIEHLQNGIDLATARYANALNKLEDTQLAMAQVEADVRQTYLVIDAPTIPEKPEASLRELAMKIGAFIAVGILVSGGAVAGGAILDRSIRFPQDINQHLELPVLATIPDITPQPLSRWRRLIARMRIRRSSPASQAEDSSSKAPVDETGGSKRRLSLRAKHPKKPVSTEVSEQVSTENEQSLEKTSEVDLVQTP